MRIDFRFPNITADTQEGQLMQVKRYLHQLVEQLNWAMNTMESGSNTALVDAKGNPIPAAEMQKGDPVSTFNSVKALIIKSADIVNAYYEQINKKLEGLYVAESDFGTYKEQTAQTISANSQHITQIFESIETIDSNVESINDAFQKTNAYIKTGEIDNSGQYPVYGIEVGQEVVDGEETVFRKFARFTANRLSFYNEAEYEVAYISGTKLFITEAHITVRLTVGEYELDTSDGLAFV